MPVWSSPFPCRVPSDWDAPVPFPGPEGSLLLFDSPDHVLQHWGRQRACDGAELERFEQGCRTLLQLQHQGQHRLQASWGDTAEAPAADGITACLLLLLLQASPTSLEAYLQLDPSYLQRLLQAQSHPQQLLHQWLQRRSITTDTDQPLQRQLEAALQELDQRHSEQQRIHALLEQHRDQQRRTRRLLAGLAQARTPAVSES